MCYGPQLRLPAQAGVIQGFAGPVARTEFPRLDCFRSVRSPLRVRLSLTCTLDPYVAHRPGTSNEK